MTPESFVLDSVLERLIPLRAEEEGVRLAEDPEYLHRMRVATRRLRSALPLLAESVSAGDLALWSREIRRFTRALGRARDGDVQIIFLKELIDTWEDRALRPGLERLLLRRSQRRDRLQKGLIRELDRIFRRGGALETLEGEIRRQRVAQAFSGLHLKGLLDQYGRLPLPELMERLRAPELARPLALLREEAVAFLRVPTTDQVEAIQEALKELTVEVKEIRIALRKAQAKTPASGKAPSSAPRK